MKHPPTAPYKPSPAGHARPLLRLSPPRRPRPGPSRLTTATPLRMSVSMLAPIAESSATTWARHSAPDLRRIDPPTAGDRRSGTPITYVCLSCRAPIAADASIVARVRPLTTSFYL